MSQAPSGAAGAANTAEGGLSISKVPSGRAAAQFTKKRTKKILQALAPLIFPARVTFYIKQNINNF
jgi:hypothetical protein